MFLIKGLLFVIALFGIVIIARFDKTVPLKKLWLFLGGLLLFLVLVLVSIDVIRIGSLLLASSIIILTYGLIILIGALHEFPYWEDWYLPYF